MFNLLLNKIEIPELKEMKSHNNQYYIAGKNNLFFDELIKLYEQSSLHNSFVNNLTQKVIGSGIKSELESDNLILEKLNLNNLYNDIVLDFNLYGGFAIEVIWNTLHTKILKLNYLDFSRIRSGMIDEKTDKVELFYYSPDWTAYHKKTEVYQFFNEDTLSDNRQILYCKGHHPGTEIYPRPLYYGGLKYINIDIALATFYLNLVGNNFVGNTIIKIPTGMDPDKQKDFEDGIKRNFTSPENAGSIVVIYGDGENVVELLEFGKGSDDGKYQWLTEHTRDQILISHKIPNPLLAGIRTPGSLGGTSEIGESEKIYNENVIYPTRKFILSKIEYLNKFLLSPLQDVKVEDISLRDTKIEE